MRGEGSVRLLFYVIGGSWFYPVAVFGGAWYINSHYLQDAPLWAQGLSVAAFLLGVGIWLCLDTLNACRRQMLDLHNELQAIRNNISGRIG